MNMSFEDQIRERAYHIWQAGGMADGQAHEHWVSAEQAVRGEVATVAAEPEVILTKAPAAKSAKASAETPAAARTKAAKTAKAKTPAAAKALRAKTMKVVGATAH